MAKQRWSKRRIIAIVCGVLLLGLSLGIWKAWPLYENVLCALSVEYPFPLALRGYSSDHPEKKYPPMSSVPGNLFVDYDSIAPEYLSSKAEPLFCASATRAYKKLSLEDRFRQPTYFYVGYALEGEKELLAFLESYSAFIEQGVNFDEDLSAPPGQGSFGGDMFLRLSESLLSEHEADLSRMPMIIEIPDYTSTSFSFRHSGNGGHVRFWNWGTRYIKYGEGFPMTPAVIEKIGEIKRMYPSTNGQQSL